MSALNRNWYNLNLARSWPLDERCSLRSDAGDLLPDGILADLHVRFPTTAGAFACLAAVTVTDKVVSILIMASQSETTLGSFVPLASCTLVRPVEKYVPQVLTAMYPGVGGWVVFGAGIDDKFPWIGRFSEPEQALIMPRAARAYRPLPVESTFKLGSQTRLTGLVGLSGGNDITITKECIEIPDRDVQPGESCDTNNVSLRNAIVFRLADKTGGSAERNVLDIYRGPCGRRPESNTCEGADPIEFIGPVQPDCCGNIVIEFRGCADLSAIDGEMVIDENNDPVEVEERCGAIIDCRVQTDETCSSVLRLPDENGRLPNEFDDLCEDTSLTPPEDSDDGEPDAVVIEDSVLVDDTENSASADGELPFVDLFESVVGYTVTVGEFVYTEVGLGDDTYGTEGGGGQAFRNLAYYPGHTDVIYRRVVVDFELKDGQLGALHNAAAVFGFHEESGVDVYWQAEIDWDGYYEGFRCFRIAKVTGSTATTVVAIPIGAFSLSHTYRIAVEILPHEDEAADAWVRALLYDPDAPEDLDESIGWVRIPGLVVAESYFGMTTYRAVTRFHRFSIENTTDL